MQNYTIYLVYTGMLSFEPAEFPRTRYLVSVSDTLQVELYL